MPTVEAMLLIAVIVCGDQKFGVCTVKNSATAMRPSAGVSSRNPDRSAACSGAGAIDVGPIGQTP